MPSTISGHVTDNTGRPLDKVSVSLKGKVIAQSGTDGFFTLSPHKAGRRVAVTFSLEGYVSNTRVYDSRATGINTVVIWPIAYQVVFNPSQDFDILLAGSHIQIPANAVVAKTQPITRAQLRFTWFDVTNPRDRAAAPGDFSGRFSDGTVRRLDSYGIFDLTRAAANGSLLALRPDATIGLSIAVPRRLIRRAPKSIGFFNFDVSTGTWVHVSSFNFVPSTLTYNGSVTSFGGAHNLDDPQDTTCVTVQVLSVWNSSPMPNMSVIAHGLQYDSYGTTDANGFVCLLVQRNASFSVEAYGQVGNSFWSTPPGLQPTFTSPNFSSGAADCGNAQTCPFIGIVPIDLIVGIAAQSVSGIEKTGSGARGE
jgi:hypothetical protein